MKKMKLNMVFAIMMSMILSIGSQSCKSDDDDVILEDYIVGTWHSYKMVVFLNGEQQTLNISRDGLYSELYIEGVFKADGTCIEYEWEQDENGQAIWTSENGTYAINGNTLLITTGAIEELSFDRSSKSLCLRGVIETEYGDATIYVYLKK